MRHLIALGLVAVVVTGCGTGSTASTSTSDTAVDTEASVAADVPEGDLGDDDPVPDPVDEADETPDPVDEADPVDDTEEPAAVEVVISDFAFDDAALTIELGDTVTWSHEGDITHNVTAREGDFVSDNLANGETFTHTFTETGTFEYVCTLHGQMVATVEVS